MDMEKELKKESEPSLKGVETTQTISKANAETTNTTPKWKVADSSD